MSDGGDDVKVNGTSDSSCEKINKSLKTVHFFLSRAKLLDAHDECLRSQELLAFASLQDHHDAVSASACPLGDACPLLPGEHKDSLQELFTTLAERSAMINKVMTDCHEFSHSSEKTSGEEGTEKEDNDNEEGEGDDDDGWVLGADMFGIKTYYKTDDEEGGGGGAGQLSLRMEADQEVPVFEQMAVLYESELYSDWIPFCTSSSLIKKISHTEQIFHSHFTTPVALRDMLVHVYSSDCVMDHGCVVFVGRSVTEDEIAADAETTWPAHPNYFFGCRVDIRQLSGVMRMTSSKSAKTIILMKVDPKLHLPQMVINFLIKKMAGVFLYFLQKKAISLAEEANTKCKHAQAMQGNPDFYVDWLLPVVRAYCQIREWGQFTVKLLGEAGQPEEGVEYLMPQVEL